MAGIVHMAGLLSCIPNREVRGADGGCNSPYSQPCSANKFKSQIP